jgi:hypothetical protein
MFLPILKVGVCMMGRQKVGHGTGNAAVDQAERGEARDEALEILPAESELMTGSFNIGEWVCNVCKAGASRVSSV